MKHVCHPRIRWTGLLTAILATLVLVESIAAGNHPANLMILENGTVQVGIDRRKGGSITWLSWTGHTNNAVNIHDPGRLIQQSYYAGKALDRRAEGQSPAWSPWTWNPIQGGGVASWARVTAFERTGSDTLFAETIPKLWDMPDEEAAARLRQWTSFEPAMSNVVVVRCELLARREPEDRWGAPVLRAQEIPACYFTRHFGSVKSYLGQGRWREESHPPGPPWGRANPPRQAMACFAPDGQGIAVFSPAAAQPWNFGPHGQGASDDPLAGPCMHVAPLDRVALGPASIYRYRYWLVVGTADEIASQLEVLWEKYSKEQTELIEADAAASIHPAAAPARPNVVMILADDLGWSDTTLHGTTKFYQTPNIERLAKRGMLFTRAYAASPLCSPTRAAILTGLSPARVGITAPNCHLPEVLLKASVEPHGPPGAKATLCRSVTRLDTHYFTLAKALKAAGYATGHFGKWHLGPEPYSPLEHGFDVDVPHWPGPGPAGSFVAPWKYPNFKENAPGEHIEDRLASEAVAFIERHRDRPFFLNYWQFSVHAPFDAKPALIEKHRGRVNPAAPQRSPTYAAMVESLDDAVGTLLDALDRFALTDRTIVIFSSDNGGNMYDSVDGTTPTSNAPLRGGKATMFEGGTRVPCVIAWPGITRPGSRSDAMIQSEDFYPTLLGGLGLAPAAVQRFDGTNFLSALKGEPFDRGAIFQFFPHNPPVPDWLPPSVSVHRGDWKLIRVFHGGAGGSHRHLLFNLRDDLGETNNLAAQRPELVRELDALIEHFLAETGAVVPKPNPAFNPAKYRPELEGKPRDRRKGNAAVQSAPPVAESASHQRDPSAGDLPQAGHTAGSVRLSGDSGRITVGAIRWDAWFGGENIQHVKNQIPTAPHSISPPESPSYVNFDDDYDSDADGPLTLCMLRKPESTGECRLIAYGTNESHEDATDTMAVALCYYGRADMPLGSYSR